MSRLLAAYTVATDFCQWQIQTWTWRRHVPVHGSMRHTKTHQFLRSASRGMMAVMLAVWLSLQQQ